GTVARHMRSYALPLQPCTGVELERLESSARNHRMKAIMLTSSCHNPLGSCMPDAIKAAIVGFAAKHGIALIESDLFGELVFDGTRPRTFKAFATDGIALPCSSLAPYVAPGLTLCWLQPGT